MSRTASTKPASTKGRKPRAEPKFDERDIDTYTEVVAENCIKINRTHLFITYFLDEDGKTKADLVEYWKEHITKQVSKYIVCQETCPTTGSIHFHLLISAIVQFKLNGIDRMIVPGFKRPNVRIVNATNVLWCIKYCSKEDPEPLCEGYEPIKPKLSLSMPTGQYKAMVKSHFEGRTITEEMIQEVADRLGISQAASSRFEREVKKICAVQPNDNYTSGKEVRLSEPVYRVPDAIGKWLKYIETKRESYTCLVVRTPFPDTMYDLLERCGPHIYHKNYIDYNTLSDKTDNKDARFMVMKKVSTFTSMEDAVTKHCTYLENLLTGSGKFAYGMKYLFNHLPVVYIEDSNSDFSLLKTYSKYLSNVVSVEIVNFDKDNYLEILNDEEVIRETNSECLKHDALRCLMIDPPGSSRNRRLPQVEGDINSFTIVRKVNPSYALETDTENDSFIRTLNKPKQINK